MSKPANPTVIGAFVVGAVLLAVIAFALFGGAQFFAQKNRYVALFDEPTNGLRVGANVLLNGVRIGYVSDIDLIIDDVNFDTDTQVTLEILPDDIMTRSGESITAEFAPGIDHEVLIIDAGLRATLAVESFVTGQLRVELQLRPETVPIMRATYAEYPEIPTITSNIQELINKVQSWFADIRENVDITDLSKRLSDGLRALDELVRSEDLRQSLAGINRLVNDEDTQQLSASLQTTLRELRTAAANASVLFEKTGGGVEVLVSDIKPILTEMRKTLRQAEQTIAVAKNQLKGDTEQAYQLGATMDELQRAAASIAEFFDYLERNPESLLRGKSQ
jgi:paraquat-inducible protein B